ncbi:MAG: 30S ribosomal protein S12 methylthiotransferase RimO [Candidatus Omnitrophica bacterium]|nr:30S ribosomal protein S12 methylthiotransferase RimO [Candidatus Omnitrophota bacterium]MCB9720803.1 30S ribosomal protein S12 methylthiotransferase RimO [Candidatus Omnitrophota bacterium]
MIERTKTTKDFMKERVTQGQKIGLINLGCARNTVDSQTILSNLKRQGHRIVDIEDSEVAIVNTCAFIDEAKQESLDTIVDLLELKKQGKIKRVIVAGCLAQRYHKELAEEFKDIDAIIGAQRLDRTSVPSDVTLTPAHFAYVKISESCYNKCSFCIIPKIKGKFVSRTIESVVEEVQQLDRRGVSEINIIGQDITAYGMDIYHELSLARLLKELVKVTNNIRWIRLLYAFPAHVTDELIDVIAQEDKICKYIDIPLQHISDHILRDMNRNISTQGTIDLMRKFKTKIPNGSLRTTFILGLPGESDADFDELKEFVRATRFEKMGTFLYSREDNTPAAAMPNQVPDKVKKERMDELMRIQQEISEELQAAYVGRTLEVLIDEQQQNEEGLYLGRSQYDAPEVDGLVYVQSARPLRAGEFVQVKILDALAYDLVGEAL